MKIQFTIILLCLLFIFIGSAQAQDTIIIRNGSFEDTPRKGGGYPLTIQSWNDCGPNLFPGESPPDIHPVPTGAWEVKFPPKDGDTYLGLVTRFNDSFEALSQRLIYPLTMGKCYAFRVFLAKAPEYKSITMRSSKYPENFTSPIVLRIWAGASHCEAKQLIAESIPIDHSEWVEYEFVFKAERSYSHIMLAAACKGETNVFYNGHVLVDGMSSIVEVECN